MAKFCTKCGKEIQEGNQFCNGCGTPVSGGNPTTAAIGKMSNKEVVFELLKNKKILGGLAAIVIVVIIAIVILGGSSYKTPIKELEKAFNKRDAGIMMAVLPEQDYKGYDKAEIKKELQKELDDMEEIDVSFDIISKKKIDEDDYEEYISDSYLDEYDIDIIYRVRVDISGKVDGKEVDSKDSLYVGKIDGDWYIVGEVNVYNS